MTEVSTTLRSAYLAGPMRGVKGHNFPLFLDVAEYLRGKGWIIWSPAERDLERGFDPIRTFSEYMEYDLPEVARADALILLPGWRDSQGARLEAMVAVELGHPVFEMLGTGLVKEGWSLGSVSPEVVREVFAPSPKDELAQMRTFETGATRNVDETKLDYEGFTSPLALQAFAEYMHRNRVQKDGTVRNSDNWQKGIPLDSYMKSLRRHVHDAQLHHDGYGDVATEDLWSALNGAFFNLQGYMHELFKATRMPHKGVITLPKEGV